ncbi:hypothetical protein KBB42_02515 [Candidatus Dojkabacteria bacterium]|nr:hypothetical protein [Candidatus Dojkabacteria bacterium]HNW33220.1 hypothetical protein [Candidatus Dojkabacteria bacterium]
MKLKIKPILSIASLVILSVLFLISLLANTVTLIYYLNLKNDLKTIDNSMFDELENQKWILQKQLAYKDNICEIRSKLPNGSSESIFIVVKKYEKEIPITTDINPYPQYTTVSEVGIVESSTPVDIIANTKEIRLYRIELLSDPNIYIEYISHKDKPYLYILGDPASSEFLLYPIVSKQIVPIDTAHYIIIINSSTLEN